MSEVIKGTIEPQLQSLVRRADPRTGYMDSSTYKTFNESKALALFYGYANVGYEVEMESVHGVHVVRASGTFISGGGEVTIDSWQIQMNQESKHECTNPFHKVGASPIEDKDLYIIAHAEKRNITLNEAFVELQGLSEFTTLYPSATAVSNARSLRLFERMKRNGTNYFSDTMVLNHTTNCSSRSTANIADTNVRKLFSHAQFLSEITDSSLWVYPAPPAIQYALSYFFNNYAPDPTHYDAAYYFWSWQKTGSNRSTAADNRVDINTSYLLDLWPRESYPLAV